MIERKNVGPDCFAKKHEFFITHDLLRSGKMDISVVYHNRYKITGKIMLIILEKNIGFFWTNVLWRPNSKYKCRVTDDEKKKKKNDEKVLVWKKNINSF